MKQKIGLMLVGLYLALVPWVVRAESGITGKVIERIKRVECGPSCDGTAPVYFTGRIEIYKYKSGLLKFVGETEIRNGDFSIDLSPGRYFMQWGETQDGSQIVKFTGGLKVPVVGKKRTNLVLRARVFSAIPK